MTRPSLTVRFLIWLTARLFPPARCLGLGSTAPSCVVCGYCTLHRDARGSPRHEWHPQPVLTAAEMPGPVLP